MELTYEISLYELIIIATSIIAGGFALFQWRQSYRLKRAELVKEASCKIRDDADIASVLYTIDYGEKWYGWDFTYHHDIEAKYDKAFAYFNYICYLRQKGIFSKSEFRIFEYRIQRMSRSESFMDYLFNLYHFAKKMEQDISFYYLLNYMKKNNLLEDDFWNVNSDQYEHILNI